MIYFTGAVFKIKVFIMLVDYWRATFTLFHKLTRHVSIYFQLLF
jgi:hypothetical protein